MTFLSWVANGSDRERISKLLFAFDFSYGIDGNKSETAYFPRIFFFIINNNYFQGYLKKTRTQKKRQNGMYYTDTYRYLTSPGGNE